MKITRTLLLVLIVTISLGAVTAAVRAQPAASQPADGAETGGTFEKVDENGTDTPEAKTNKSTTQPGDETPPPKPGLLDNPMVIPIMIGAMFLMFIFTGKKKRKAEKQRKEMLSVLKKGDKVTTIGGIIGTVLEVRDDEVNVKIDESSNARMRFARWAIRGVGDDAKTEKPEDKK
jgi:preprotein translocase subunit YajC